MWIREISFFLRQSREILIDVRLGMQKASSQLVIGLLHAIEDFTKQFDTAQNQGVKQIAHGDYKLLLEYGNWIGCAILSQVDSKWLRSRMIYLVALFEEKYQDALQFEPKDVSQYQEFHGIMLNILPHDLLIRDTPYEPKIRQGIQEVPFFEGEYDHVLGREGALLRLADGTRTLREIAEIDGTSYITVIQEYRALASKGVKLVKKLL